MNTALPKAYGDAVRETGVRVWASRTSRSPAWTTESNWLHRRGRRPAGDHPARPRPHRGHGRRRGGDRRGSGRAAGRAARAVRHAHRRGAAGAERRLRLASTSPRRSTAPRSRAARRRACPTRWAPADLVDGLDEASSASRPASRRRSTPTLRHGEQAGTRPQITATVNSVKEKELPDGRRRVRPAGERVRHRRTNCAPTCAPGWSGVKALDQGSPGPGQAARAAARHRRVPAAGVGGPGRGRVPRARVVHALGHDDAAFDGTSRRRARPARSSPPSCARSPRSR